MSELITAKRVVQANLRTETGDNALVVLTAGPRSLVTSSVSQAALEAAVAATVPTSADLDVQVASGLFPIREVELAAQAATIDITGIPAGYRNLLVIGSLRSNVATTFDTALVEYNGDTAGANYNVQAVHTANTTTTGTQSIAASAARSAVLTSGATSGAGDYAPFRMWIPGYASLAKTKLIDVGQAAPTTRASAGLFTRRTAQHWYKSPIEAINRITFTPATGTGWVAGSVVSVYGVQAAIPL